MLARPSSTSTTGVRQHSPPTRAANAERTKTPLRSLPAALFFIDSSLRGERPHSGARSLHSGKVTADGGRPFQGGFRPPPLQSLIMRCDARIQDTAQDTERKPLCGKTATEDALRLILDL